jgi:hypothetical protein
LQKCFSPHISFKVLKCILKFYTVYKKLLPGIQMCSLPQVDGIIREKMYAINIINTDLWPDDPGFNYLQRKRRSKCFAGLIVVRGLTCRLLTLRGANENHYEPKYSGTLDYAAVL